MKPLNVMTLLALTLASNSAFATHDSESSALRKVIGAIEVANLNTVSPGIPQITCDLVDSAISLLENGNDQPIGGIALGTYTTPNWFDNRDADADFTLPWGFQPRSFSFVVRNRAFADYILVFGRNGEELYREDVSRHLATSTLTFQLPNHVNPARVSVIRLHNIARRGTRITAYAGNGHFDNDNDSSQALSILNDVKMALVNQNPDMYFVKTRLAYVERLLRQ